ncbi:MAG: stringent starvation protein [Candidatus Binatota bacterium]|jgi:RNA polymerase-associated protein|nr:stringent starvation protein [Candidatus Binatota bacterium]
MKLYDYPQCPFCQKVRIVLAEKELSYEKINVDLRKSEQMRPEFLKMNPFHKVPVLIDEDLVLYDSTVINEYLEDEYPHPQLMPPDSGLRARVRLLEDYADTAFILPVGVLMAEVRKAESERDPERVRRSRDDVERALGYLNVQLGEQAYLAGEFSIADAAFAPRLLVIQAVGVELKPEWDALRRWIDRLAQRPSIQNLDGLS